MRTFKDLSVESLPRLDYITENESPIQSLRPELGFLGRLRPKTRTRPISTILDIRYTLIEGGNVRRDGRSAAAAVLAMLAGHHHLQGGWLPTSSYLQTE